MLRYLAEIKKYPDRYKPCCDGTNYILNSVRCRKIPCGMQFHVNEGQDDAEAYLGNLYRDGKGVDQSDEEAA